MSSSAEILQSLNLGSSVPRDEAFHLIRTALEQRLGYHFSDIDEGRPWGAFYRIEDQEADRFLAEFFPGIDPLEARLGRQELVLSPKILVVCPAQRLSWQYHEHRAERWRFLTTGGYYKSLTNEQGDLESAVAGDVVQFDTGERHRLVGSQATYTLVAEIWQHTDPSHPSEEHDIIHLADDYNR